ncbi:MAG: reactive intermediate/imine deaminase [SAR86 cluster bacterium]|uniref:Reactive intermediate/imine deaminase n=1 Tax=SAR86 cluster bacterium TaxID=2030880 RepID=A0A2A4MTK6_9GAMM|nr:MAG: reactive intermediate/imine deaminase [SAR86 cluster bacterium]
MTELQPELQPTLRAIHSELAPNAIGPYSQATKTGKLVFLSGQIALNPQTMELVEGGIEAQARQVFKNLDAVACAAGGSLQTLSKLTIYLCDLGDFSLVNKIMAELFQAPYPARATVGISSLPKNALIEIDGILVL